MAKRICERVRRLRAEGMVFTEALSMALAEARKTRKWTPEQSDCISAKISGCPDDMPQEQKIATAISQCAPQKARPKRG